MTGPGPIALGAVLEAEAEAERGVHEQGGNNRGPRVEAYLRAVALPAGSAWCAAFVEFCLEESARKNGRSLPSDWPLSGWCPALAAWAKYRGLWIPALGSTKLAGTEAPQRGDLALFWFAAKGRVAHVGLLASGIGNGIFRTVEGNTSGPAVAGVNREGDGVFAKARTLTDLGASGGFARLPW